MGHSREADACIKGHRTLDHHNQSVRGGLDHQDYIVLDGPRLHKYFNTKVRVTRVFAYWERPRVETLQL